MQKALVVAVVAAVVGLVGAWVAYGPGRMPESVPHLVTGWSAVGSGLVAWKRAPTSRCGSLLVLVGLTWFASDFGGCLNVEPLSHRCLQSDALARGAEATAWLWLAILAHAILTYPNGRARSAFERAACLAAYVLAAAIPWWEAGSMLMAVLLAAGPVLRWALARPGDRPEVVPSVVVGSWMAMVLLLLEAGPPYLLDLGVTLACLGLVAGLVGIAARREALSPDMAVGLGGSLAAALGDPGFRVSFRASDDAWVDSTGQRVGAPRAGPGVELTQVGRDGARLAVIAHDPATLANPEVRGAVTMAVELAAHNARLRTDLADQLAEVDASRRRLLDAALRERRDLGSRVEVDVERPLGRLADDVAVIGGEGPDSRVLKHLARASQELAIARTEIADLATGLFPRLLAAGGLAAALRELGSRSPVPVDLDVMDGLTGGHAIDATIYFVSAEALANAARHAGASRVQVTVTLEDDAIEVVIIDDGSGGADLAGGSGLRGLRDRVEARGGTLSLESPPGTGTRLVATIPVSPEARDGA